MYSYITIFTTAAVTVNKAKRIGINDLQAFPRESKSKDMAVMLVVLTKKANKKSCVKHHQHGN